MKLLLIWPILILFSDSAYCDPKNNYKLHCMGCHLTDGRGMPPEVPRFDSTLGKIVSTAAGRKYLVQVPGSSQAPISDAELAGLLNWLLKEFAGNSLPKRFVPYSKAEITRYREHILKDPKLARVELLGTANYD